MANNIRVIFNKEAELILEDIIKKFGLEESPEEFLEKAQRNKLSNVVIITHLSRKFAGNEISKEELVDSLQKELETPAQRAKEIAREIIDNLVPLLIKVPEEKLEDPDFVDRIFGESSISVSPAKEKEDRLFAIPEPLNKTHKSESPYKKKEPRIPFGKKSLSKEKSNSSRKFDKYREPIE